MNNKLAPHQKSAIEKMSEWILGYLRKIPVRRWHIIEVSLALSALAAIGCLITFICTENILWLELLANSILVIGALTIANGVLLPDRERDVLFESKNKNVRYYATQESLLKIQIELMELKQGDTTELKKELAEHIDQRPSSIRVSYLAGVLIRASDWAEAGTILVVAGTLLLALMGVLKATHPESALCSSEKKHQQGDQSATPNQEKQQVCVKK